LSNKDFPGSTWAVAARVAALPRTLGVGWDGAMSQQRFLSEQKFFDGGD
jgi:hypothetical protein